MFAICGAIRLNTPPANPKNETITNAVPAVKKPPTKFKTLKEVFEEILEHERFISNSINEIVALSIAEKDYST